MTDRSSDEDLAQLVAELATTLRELESEIDPPEPESPRVPTLSDLARFTSEVAIPGLILLLETNIRALRLLQRTIQLAEGGERAAAETEQLRARAQRASETTLDRLDGALVELQDALEGRPESEEARSLLSEAQELRGEVQDRLAESRTSPGGDGTPPEADPDEGGNERGGAPDGSDGDSANSSDPMNLDGGSSNDDVQIDVESELSAIKDELEMPAEDEPGDDGTVGTDGTEGTDDGDADGETGDSSGDYDGTDGPNGR
jgi:hypothetical protein